MIATPNTKEYRIIVRQLAVKQKGEKSMISIVRNLLSKYSLPTAYDLMRDTPTKENWKNILRESVNKVVEYGWRNDINEKPSLKYLNLDILKVGQPHIIYSTVRPNVHDVQRAELKAKIITGTYILLVNRAKFNQFEVNPTCGLCCQQPETREHFIAQCSSLSKIRTHFITKTANLLHISPNVLSSMEASNFTQFCLDCTHPLLSNYLKIPCESQDRLEYYTRKYIFNIHFARSKLLEN